jgi:hypothetical protein
MRKPRKIPDTDAGYMREQAQRCYRLAREIMDRDVREKLEELGREFEQKAKELEQKNSSKPGK